MSADLDVRAWTYCNVGPVISGNLEESSIVGAGLVNVSGSVLLDGVFNVREGQVIELSYYKNGRMARLGRKLRAISSYANPVTRTTEVRLGCYLTYQANSEPPPRTLSSVDDTDPEALELTGIAKLLLIKPTRAAYVAEQCCAALGLQHDPFPLTNTFYREDFEIKGPYLRILSDLLISENYVGYISTNEVLKFINLNNPGGAGPVLDENKIIDISPVNVGEPDADVVYSIVNHKKIKLDAALDTSGGGGGGTAETIEEILERNEIPDTEEVREVIEGTADEETEENVTYTYGYANPYWLKGYNTGPDEVRYFRYTPNKTAENPEPTPIFGSITYRNYSKWEAGYNRAGVLTKRIEQVNGPWGVSTTTTTYENSVSNGVEYTKETTKTVVPAEVIVEACQFPKEAVIPLPADIKAARGPSPTILTEIVTVEKRATETQVLTTESRSCANVFTSDGAANISNILYSYTEQYKGTELEGKIPVAAIVAYASAFVFDATRFSYSEKAPTQSIRNTAGAGSSTGTLPPNTSSVDFSSLTEKEQEDLINRELEAPQSGDPDSILDPNNSGDISAAGGGSSSRNGATYNVVEVPEILYTKNTTGGIMLEYTPPYLPDDRVVASGGGYSVIPSDAVAKAKAFADRQNTLRFGYRNGQSIVFPIEYTPNKPFAPIYLKFGGVIGQYRTDRLSIAFDNTGILVSTDAIFWGGVGK